MPLDLPNTPIPGDSFTLPDGSEVVWDGEKWHSPNEAFLPLAGGVMLGPIILEPPYPLNQYEAGHKQYIDEMIMAQAYYQGLWWVKDNNPNLDPAVAQPLNGYSWLAQTEDPNVPELAPAGLPGIGGQPINAGDSIRWNAGAAIYERVRGASMGSVEAMLMFLQLAGGRMHGRLILADGTLTDTHQATPKWYVDQLAGISEAVAELRFVNVSGDQMTGMLTLSNDPTVDLHSASKRYVDQSIAAISLFQGIWFVAANNPDLTPAVVLPEHTYSWIAQTVDPNIPETVTAALPGLTGLLIAAGDHVVWNANTSAYVHIRGASLNAIEARAVFIEAAGNSMTGVLNLFADPIGDMEAVNKRYLDAQVASGLSQAEADLLYVSGVTAGLGLAGGGTSGDITLSVVQATQAVFGGAEIATSGEISSGTADAFIVSPLGLRGQLGADASSLVTTNKTVIPAINELISAIAAAIGVLVFAGAYDAQAGTGTFNGNGGIAQGQNMPLPAPSTANYGSYLLVVMPGPGGGPNEPAAAMEAHDWLISDGVTWILVKFGPVSIAFLPLTGGIMQGFITAHSDPTANMHVATKAYVDNSTLSQAEADAAYVRLAGSTMTGHLTLNADPTAPLHAATRQYIDTRAVVQATQTVLGGGEIATAAEIAAGTADTFIVSPLGLRSQLGADAQLLVTSAKTVVPAINELISDITALVGIVIFGGTYDANANVATFNGQGGIAAGTGPLPAASAANGGTFLIVNVGGAGGAANEPADTMSPMDWLISDSTRWVLIKFGSQAAWLPLSGGTMTGFITTHANPTANLHVANKQYVDTRAVVQATQTLLGGGEIATASEIATGTADTFIVSPLGLRSQLGADAQTLVTSAKTVVPAINEIISDIAAIVGIVVFGGTYNANTNVATFNGQGGITAGTGPLPIPSVVNGGTFLIVNVGGAGGGPNEPVDTMSPQDWLISDSTRWILIKFGSQAAWLPLSGGVMTGFITLHSPPTAELHAATKAYVDSAVGGAGGGTITGVTAGIGLTGGGTTGAVTLALDTAYVDGRFVNVTGDVMTGPLTTSGSVGGIASTTTVAGLEVRAAGGATDAAYIAFHRPGLYAVAFGLDTDHQLAYGGWSMGATRRVLWDTNNLNPANYVLKTGDTMTGTLTTPALTVTSGAWMIGALSMAAAGDFSAPIYFASSWGTTNVYFQAFHVLGVQAGLKLAIGDPGSQQVYTFDNQGYFILPRDPASPMDAATKQYVDAQVAAQLTQAEADALYVNVAGDTMTGALNGTSISMTGNVAGAYVWSGGNIAATLDITAGRNIVTPALSVTTSAYLSGNTYVNGGLSMVAVGDYSSALYFQSSWGLTNLYFQAFHNPGIQAGLNLALGDQTALKVYTFDSAGFLSLPNDPVMGWHAATKQYVDAQITAQGDARYVNITGDVMTGALTSPNFTVAPGTAAAPTGAAITIGARDGSATFTHYATGNILRWYAGLMDRMTLTNGGNLSIWGAFQAALITSAGGCNSASVGTSYLLVSGNADVTGNVGVTGGTTTDSVNVRSVWGISYSAYTAHWIAFTYNATTYRMGAYIDGAWLDNIAMDWQLAGYLPLTGGTLYNGGNDPLQIMASNGNYARITYHTINQRIWSAGVNTAGQFAIADESGAATRAIWGLDGTLNQYGNIVSPGSFWCWDITCGGTVFTGYVNTVATISAGGQISGAYIHSSGGIGAVGDIGGLNISATAQVWGNTVVSNAITSYGGVIGITYMHSDGYINCADFRLRGSYFATLDAGATCTTIYAAGVVKMYMILTGTTYYDTNQHNFRSIGGGTAYCYFDPSGCWNATGSWGSFSSRDLKENIVPYNTGLAAILALRPVSYNYIAGTPFADEVNLARYGLIADEVAPHIPEMVTETTYNTYRDGIETAVPTVGLYPGHLVYVLTNAVKELASMNDALTARVAALEAMLPAGTA